MLTIILMEVYHLVMVTVKLADTTYTVAKGCHTVTGVKNIAPPLIKSANK